MILNAHYQSTPSSFSKSKQAGSQKLKRAENINRLDKYYAYFTNLSSDYYWGLLKPRYSIEM